MTLTTAELLTFLTALVTVFCPPVAMSIYAAVANRFPTAAQGAIARRLFFRIALLLVALVWLGQGLLHVLGITTAALSMTGGIVLILWSVPMMLGSRQGELPTPSAVADGGWQTMLAVPLVFPMSIGGAAASLVIATAAQCRSWIDLAAVSAICVIHAGLIGLTFRLSAPFSHRLGALGMEMVQRVSGIVVTAVAVQMLAHAVRDLLHLS